MTSIVFSLSVKIHTHQKNVFIHHQCHVMYYCFFRITVSLYKNESRLAESSLFVHLRPRITAKHIYQPHHDVINFQLYVEWIVYNACGLPE